jgi:hypothetical protein
MKSNSVLARLAASWGISADAAPVAADVAALQTEFDAFRAQAAGELAEVQGVVDALATAVKEVEAERDALTAKLSALETANADVVAQAAAAKVKAREDKLIALLGTERAAPVIQATNGLPDEGFEAVVAAMTAASAAESTSPLFTEAGVQAEAKASAADGPSLEMQILRKQYAKSAA